MRLTAIAAALGCAQAIAVADDVSSAASARVEIDPRDVSKLIEQLGSSARREREAAEQKLLSFGVELLPLLPSATPEDVPAIGAAVERIRNSLEHEAARKAAEPSLVSLQGKLELGSLAEELERQTGNPLTVDDANATISVEWKDRAWWDAIDDLARQDGIRLEQRERALRLVRHDPDAPGAGSASVNSGPIRVEILGISRKLSQIQADQEIVQVRWRLRTEPRLRPLYLIVADKDTSVVVGRTELRPLSPDAKRELPMDRFAGSELDSTFVMPAGETLSEAMFSISATLKVAALPLPLEFNDLARRAPLVERRGGVTAVLRTIERDKSGTVRLSLAVTYDRSGPEFESHRLWIHENAAWLKVASSGQTFLPARADLSSTNRTGGTLSFEFENVPAAIDQLQFVYEAPSLVIDVPMNIKAVPLQLPKARSDAGTTD